VLQVEQHLRPAGNEALAGLQQLRRLSCDTHELRYVNLSHLRKLSNLEVRACDTSRSNKMGLARVQRALLHLRNITHFAVVSTTPIALTPLLRTLAASCPHLRQLKIHQAVHTEYKPVRPAAEVMHALWQGCLGLREIDFGRTVWR
jgi:hypothetical protein